MKLKTHICAVCGCEYQAAGPNRLYCDDCVIPAKLAINRIHRRLGATIGPGEKRAAIAELARKIKSCGQGCTEATRHTLANATKCHYCGRPTRAEKDYCDNCVRWGYDGIHMVTGRTNGWDKVEAEKHGVSSGRRGQKCMGGCASDFRSRIDR